MKHYVFALVFTSVLSSGMFHGCEKKCGCEADPSRTITNVEATYHHPIHLHLLGTPELYFIICNENAIPDEIRLAAENAGIEGLNVHIGGKIHNGCNLRNDSYIPNGITLTFTRLTKNPPGF
jgi:hypothetical protein